MARPTPDEPIRFPAPRARAKRRSREARSTVQVQRENLGLIEEARLIYALDELGRAAASEPDLRQLSRFATSVLKEAVGLAHVALALVDWQRQVAEHLASASDLDVPLRPGDTQPLSRGLVGLCAREDRTVYVSDVHEDPNYVGIIPGVVEELVVPVKARGRVIAVINCESREAGVLKGQAVFLEVAANRLGVAFENARLLREREEALKSAQRHSQQLEALNDIARIATSGELELRPLLQRITEALALRFGWEFVACITVDAEAGTFVCQAVHSDHPTDVYVGYGRKLGSGVVGEVAATGLPLLIDDVRTHANYVETLPGAMSELCVPVKLGGKLVAIINLESKQPAAFHDKLGLLETVADQVAGAIAGARAHEEVKRRASILEMLSEISRAAMEASELQTLLDRVVGYVHSQFKLWLAAVVMVTDAGDEFELLAHVGDMPLSVARGARWPVDHGVVGRALRHGEPQLLLDVKQDPDYVMLSPDVAAEYAIPIRFQGKTLGVLDLESITPDVFSADNMMAMRTIVDQIAGALHMATMNRRLTDANKTLSDLFSRYVAPDVAEMLVSDPDRYRSTGERVEASVLFADIRGFTSLSQRLDSQTVLGLLNEYYTAMGEAIFLHRGSINAISGDGLMAVFGVPEKLKDHATAAVKAALHMQKIAERLAPRWLEIAGVPLSIVVAVNSGDVIAGSLGDPRHMEFTVLGDVVNVAARLETEAKARDARILIAGSTYDALTRNFGARLLGRLELRGREGAVRVYELL